MQKTLGSLCSRLCKFFFSAQNADILDDFSLWLYHQNFILPRWMLANFFHWDFILPLWIVALSLRSRDVWFWTGKKTQPKGWNKEWEIRRLYSILLIWQTPETFPRPKSFILLRTILLVIYQTFSFWSFFQFIFGAQWPVWQIFNYILPQSKTMKRYCATFSGFSVLGDAFEDTE